MRVTIDDGGGQPFVVVVVVVVSITAGCPRGHGIPGSRIQFPPRRDTRVCAALKSFTRSPQCALVHLFKTYRSTSRSSLLAPAPIPCPMIHSRAHSPPFQIGDVQPTGGGEVAGTIGRQGGRWWRYRVGGNTSGCL